MRAITLDDLPLYSPWPRWLIGDNGYVPLDRPRVRTPEWVGNEYGEKYRGLLKAYHAATKPLDYEEVRELELPEREVSMSRGGRLYVTSLREAMEESILALLKILTPEAMLTGVAVDLGCGYGYTLHRLRTKAKHVKLYGGELSPPGVTLARSLNPELGVEEFDFLSGPCRPLEQAHRPAVVFTSYALHQLVSAERAVEMLAKYREKIECVINLEPEEDHFGSGLLGLLRRRYGQINGYSADLNRVLSRRSDVEVVAVEESCVGANALLPASLTVWRFR